MLVMKSLSEKGNWCHIRAFDSRRGHNTQRPWWSKRCLVSPQVAWISLSMWFPYRMEWIFCAMYTATQARNPHFLYRKECGNRYSLPQFDVKCGEGIEKGPASRPQCREVCRLPFGSNAIPQIDTRSLKVFAHGKSAQGLLPHSE
jgi:hypothetical protein